MNYVKGIYLSACRIRMCLIKKPFQINKIFETASFVKREELTCWKTRCDLLPDVFASGILICL